MFSPKIVVVLVASALIAGGVAGRWTAPGFSKTSGEQAASFSSTNAATADRSRALADPGDNSRAIADVTPGKNTEKEKPIASLAELLRGSNYMKLYRDAGRFAESLDENGVRKSLQMVDAANEGNAKRTLQYSLVSRLAELDPQAAIQYVSALKSNLRGNLLSVVSTAWAAKDFNAAKAWALQLPDKRDRGTAMQGIIGALVEKDPDKALQLSLTLPNSANQYNNYSYMIFQALASRSPQSAAQKALALPNGQSRQQALSIVASEWANTDPLAAAQWAENLTGRAKQSAIGNIVSNWAQRDPLSAAAYAEKMPSGDTRNQALANLASTWAQQDTAAALQWVESLPADESRNNALRNTLSSWASNDPKAAAEYAMKMPPDDKNVRTYSLQAIGNQWASQDPEAALKWAALQNDPKISETFVGNVFSQWANSDPEKAIASLDLIKDQKTRDQATQQIAQQWSNDNPEKAITWLATLPATDTRDNSLKNAVVNWTQNSPEETSQWIAKLPLGKTRDQMVGTFAGNVLQQDPEASAAWSNTISDPETRKSGVAWALKTWSKNDRLGATTWVNRQNFSPEDRTAFLNSVNNP